MAQPIYESSLQSAYHQIPNTPQNISPTLQAYLRQQGITSSMDQGKLNTIISNVGQHQQQPGQQPMGMQHQQMSQPIMGMSPMKLAAYSGFIKRAMEYGIPQYNAEKLFKLADFFKGLGDLTGIGHSGMLADAGHGLANVGRGLGQMTGVGGNGFHPLSGAGNVIKGVGQTAASPITGGASNFGHMMSAGIHGTMHPLNFMQNVKDDANVGLSEMADNPISHSMDALKNGISGFNPTKWNVPGAYSQSHDQGIANTDNAYMQQFQHGFEQGDPNRSLDARTNALTSAQGIHNVGMRANVGNQVMNAQRGMQGVVDSGAQNQRNSDYVSEQLRTINNNPMLVGPNVEPVDPQTMNRPPADINNVTGPSVTGQGAPQYAPNLR